MSDPSGRLREQLSVVRKESQCARARKHFYPHDDLEEILNEGAVRECLSAMPSLNGNQRDIFRFSSLIRQTALRTFAILLLDCNEAYILDFLFRREGDSRVPYSDEQGLYFLPRVVARRFLERQWEFDPVILEKGNIHLEIGENAVLPFLVDVKVARGGFGALYKVVIHPSCHKLVDTTSEENPPVARKELDADDGGSEQAVLDLLGELRHPNIVEFLGSYTQYNTRNLLFPYIPMNMKAFLANPPSLESWIMIEGIYGIADALGKIHEFDFEDKALSMSLIGYHHDLRPDNILVKGTTFLIADFGLSKMKSNDETSKSRLRGGHDDYLGPESFNSGDWTNGKVGRALDVWAFGCIVAELLTVMEGRSVGQFREARRAPQSQGDLTIVNCSFHLNGQIRPSVLDWLSSLAAETTSQETNDLVRLDLDMLNVNQYRRIKITDVTQSLALLAKEAKIKNIAQIFDRQSYDGEHRKKDKDKLLLLEHKLFNVWTKAAGHIRREEVLESITLILPNLSHLHAALIDYEQSCETTAGAGSSTKLVSPLSRISTAVDKVCCTLPAEARTKLDDLWAQAVGDIQDIQILEAVCSAPKPARYRVVGAKAAMTYMSRIISTSFRFGTSSYCIDSGCVDIDRVAPAQLIESSNITLIKDDARTMGYYHLATGKRRVMIEWKQYDHRWQCDPGDELLGIMDALAGLLDPEVTPRQGVVKDRVLDCVGYFHQQAFYRFGFVYVLPLPEASLESSSVNLFSLNNVIRMTDPDSSNAERPCLGDVFRLARDLASCLLALHKVSWLHKNLSSHHILVFSHSDKEVHRHVASAVLAGFNDSRPEASSITLGPRHEFPHYQHPLYRQGSSFRRSFDYFSLGIVLLELGLWQPVSVLRQDHCEIDSPEIFRCKLIQTYVPMLGERMGVIYRDAVAFCLGVEEDGTTDPAHSAESCWALHEQFLARVVEPLCCCRA